jgi:hypothetical protein
MAFHSPRSLYASGKVLDRLAQQMGFKRRRYFWFFKESDRHLRERIVNWLSNLGK